MAENSEGVPHSENVQDLAGVVCFIGHTVVFACATTFVFILLAGAESVAANGEADVIATSFMYFRPANACTFAIHLLWISVN